MKIQISRLVAPHRFEVYAEELGAPPPGSVRVRVQACGVCASELHAVEETLDSYPVTMGHEPVGIVEALGEGVDDLEIGTQVTGGFGPSFAERVNADRRSLVPVPAGLSIVQGIGEPLGCVVEGRRRTHVTAGDRIAIVGVGYMGLMMLQVLLATGAGYVVVLDPRPEARATALTFGATDALGSDAVESGDLDDQFDVVVEASGTQGGLDDSTRLVREHGILSVLGYHQGPPRSVDMQTWNWKAIDVVNAHVRRRDLLVEAIARGLELARLGRIRPGELVTHRFGLEGVGDAFAALAAKPDGFIKAVVLME